MKTWGPDPANPGKCIGHGGDPMKDGRFSPRANDTTPLASYMSVLPALLWPCNASAHA